jgi:hypothetical protein
VYVPKEIIKEIAKAASIPLESAKRERYSRGYPTPLNRTIPKKIRFRSVVKLSRTTRQSRERRIVGDMNKLVQSPLEQT